MLKLARIIGGRLLGFLKGLDFMQLIALALGCLCLLFLAQRNDARSDAARWEKQFRSERTAREMDRQTFVQAQLDAAKSNRADVARIETQQENINAQVKADLGARLERLRRELQQGAAAPQGSAGGAGLPANGAPAGGADAAPGVCLTAEQLLRGAENEERHDQLINWLEQQLQVKR